MFGIYVEKDPIQNYSFGCEYTPIQKKKEKHIIVFSYATKDLKNFIRNTRWKLTAVLKEVRRVILFQCHYFLMLQLYKLILKSTLALFNAYDCLPSFCCLDLSIHTLSSC